MWKGLFYNEERNVSLTAYLQEVGGDIDSEQGYRYLRTGVKLGGGQYRLAAVRDVFGDFGENGMMEPVCK